MSKKWRKNKKIKKKQENKTTGVFQNRINIFSDYLGRYEKEIRIRYKIQRKIVSRSNLLREKDITNETKIRQKKIRGKMRTKKKRAAK